MAADSAALAADFLKATDPDRYYATLVIREDRRVAVQAIYAFAADVASVRERVSEPAPGEIRLQWWDDALTGQGHGNVRQNPVADALLTTIGEYGLPVVPLQRLIAARRFDLYQDPMTDVLSFEGYAGETVSVLYQFAAMILNGGAPVEEGDAAGHLGVANALIGHSRAFGYNASTMRLFLPSSLFKAHGVSESEIFSGQATEGIRAALAQIQDLAREHLDKAAVASAVLPRTLRPAFAMVPVLRAELRQLEQGGRNPFAPPLILPAWRKLALMGWWAWRNG
ncbi:MAG TPA: phytoene/squalene synthase family protein [Devosiaceae bacterium]|jgi:phytoene synthase